MNTLAYRVPPKPMRFESGFPGRHCDIATGLSAPKNSVLLRSSAQWLGMRGTEVPAAKRSSLGITRLPRGSVTYLCLGNQELPKQSVMFLIHKKI